jgi:transposase
MISWERFMDILALHRQGFSLRDVSDKLGMHRKTVAKYVTQGHSPRYRKVKRKESILTPFLQIIDDWLQQDNYRTSWIYNQIKHLGYGGGYDTVKNHVRKVKKHYQRKAFIRLRRCLVCRVRWTGPIFRWLMKPAPSHCTCSFLYWVFPGPCMPSSFLSAPYSISWIRISALFSFWAAFRWKCSMTT